MTRDELEANWGWDPQKGSIPFKRPRLTAKNIALQQEVARPGTLIHWQGHSCERSRTAMDLVKGYSGNETATYLAVASHIENVNCLACRKTFFSRTSRPKGS